MGPRSDWSSSASQISYRVFRKKLCFFIIHCNPSFAYIAVGGLLSSQRNASVQSLLLAGNFLYNQWQSSAGGGEVANFREFLEKNTIFNEHPVPPTLICWFLSVGR